MCMKCGCGYKNGAWKYDMQPMVFKDGQMKTGPIPPAPVMTSGYEDDEED